MLTRMHLKNFKGFRDTEIAEFRKVNLIVGGQNVGKTSLLEAVVFVAGDDDDSKRSRGRLPEIFRPNEGGDSVRFWESIVGTKNKPLQPAVMATLKYRVAFMGGYENIVNLEIAENWFRKYSNLTSYFSIGKLSLNIPKIGNVDLIIGRGELKVDNKSMILNELQPYIQTPHPFSIFTEFASEQVKIYGQLVIKKKKRAVLKLLQKIESRIESIDAIAPDGEQRVYAELNNEQLLPLSQLGHGFTRLFELYSGLAVTDSKLALIDEIENGIHYSALPTVFQGIRELSESSGVQSIITTHSLECIQAACEVFKDKPEDFQIIRLERTEDDNVRAVAINDENLATVMASGWEIR